jgi:hypothetical protein
MMTINRMPERKRPGLSPIWLRAVLYMELICWFPSIISISNSLITLWIMPRVGSTINHLTMLPQKMHQGHLLNQTLCSLFYCRHHSQGQMKYGQHIYHDYQSLGKSSLFILRKNRENSFNSTSGNPKSGRWGCYTPVFLP